MPRDSLRLLTVTPSDAGGGAEGTAKRLHEAMLSRGVDAWMALVASRTGTPRTLRIPNTRYRGPWARAVLEAAGLADPAAPPAQPAALQRALRVAAEPLRFARVATGLEDFDFPATRRLADLPPERPDVLHLHNLHGSYFDVRRLPELSRDVPTILTLHDAWMLTGHCVQPMECPGWRVACRTCPYLSRPVAIRHDRAAANNAIKRRALEGGLVHLAVPSRWLAEMAEAAGHAALVAETRVIPNGVDTSVFAPGDRPAARAALGLPPDATVVLFAAQSASMAEFKGFEVLAAALPSIAAGLPGREVVLVALGGGDGGTRALPGTVVRVPFVDDPALVARHYQAADLYLHPSRAESFGLTVLEAMACGVPAVASRVGGIPEVVEEGVSGLLFEVGDPGELARAALRLLGDEPLRARFAAAGAERARTVFPFERQVDSYLRWYEELADAATRGGRG